MEFEIFGKILNQIKSDKSYTRRQRTNVVFQMDHIHEKNLK